jgi:ribosome-associated translation inhibitor RaiA
MDKSGYEEDGSGNSWIAPFNDEVVMIGIDIDDDNNGLIVVELHGEEAMKRMMGERKVETSFKKFLAEARKEGVQIEEKKTKGVVDKLIATLEGHEAGVFTKLARQYHAISKALDKLEGKKKELNAALKDQVGSTFDPKLDKYLTRVVQSTKFAATLARETPPDEIKEKVEVDYEKLVHGLMALISEELKPAADELVKGATRRWKPDPKSPNLLVKPLDEGVADTLAGWWRAAKEKLAKHLARFDKGLASLEKQLAKLKTKRLAEAVNADEDDMSDFISDNISSCDGVVHDLWLKYARERNLDPVNSELKDAFCAIAQEMIDED